MACVLLRDIRVKYLRVTVQMQEDSVVEPATLETYRQQLLTMQKQLTQRIFDVEETMYAMDAERDIERTDRVQEEAAEVALTALDEQGRREMAEISAALARMDEGTYGICEVCAEPIGAARLAAMPMARRCVPCQERLEHRRIR
jgi:RNA polymerase-binding protein DksA